MAKNKFVESIESEAKKPTKPFLPNERKKSEIEIESCFTVKTANEWIDEAKNRPIPKMLFGELWFEGELCILYSDTNLGKSILGVQIGENIANGLRIYPFENGSRKQKVIYFDFELSEKQFEIRYSEKVPDSDFLKNHYKFSENFLRAEINPNNQKPERFRTFEDYLIYSIEQQVIMTDAKVLIVDNITYLKNATETAKDALPLMKELKTLKEKYGLSILALAHTPKRDHTRPITKNDLQGSRMLMNFCDSSFAIGESTREKSLRYIKQIKERNTPKLYGEDNVAVFKIIKNSNFLEFEFSDYGHENDHLKIVSDANKAVLYIKAKAYSQQGKSQREIADLLGISQASVNRYLKKSVESDESVDLDVSDDSDITQ